MAHPTRHRPHWSTVLVAALALAGAATPAAAAEPPTAQVLGGFEARLTWEDPAPGTVVLLTLIIYPSNAGSIDGPFTCDQAAAAPAHQAVYTQEWDERYDPTRVDLYVHAFQRCTGDWGEGETFPFRLEVYQLPGYDTPAASSEPLLVVEGAAPPGDSLAGLRPAGTPISATVQVTPADPAATPDAPGPGEAGDPSEGPGSATTVPQAPPDESHDAFSLPALRQPGQSPRWSAPGLAILVLFLILMALAVGMTLKAAIAAVLGGRVTAEQGLPTARETAILARDVALVGSATTLVTVSSPVQPRSGPADGAADAGFMLQPGEPFELLGDPDTGPGTWVQVRQGGNVGWVHRATLQDWTQEVIVRPPPPTANAPYREWVTFPGEFETRGPGSGTFTRRPPGSYRVGPPDPGGYRPVYDANDKPVGSIPADRVPSRELRRGQAPLPPPPEPPPPPAP